jgi:hypothetical protein
MSDRAESSAAPSRRCTTHLGRVNPPRSASSPKVGPPTPTTPDGTQNRVSRANRAPRDVPVRLGGHISGRALIARDLARGGEGGHRISCGGEGGNCANLGR